MFYLQQREPSVWTGSFSSFSSEFIVHAISTRFGGVTRAPFDTMDLALHTGDDAALVWKNRQLFCAALGLQAERICTPQQVHGEHILRVTEQDAGRGSRSYEDAIADTDALITDVPELPLLLCFADCTPLLFFDPVHRAVGAAHGGWKGTVQKIAQKTVLRMQQEFGTKPEECLVGIGPAIGPCCYEVGEDVVSRFSKAFPGQEQKLFHRQGQSVHLSLWEANRLQLTEIGVKIEHIDAADVCTACNSRLFFSYRADNGRTGRIAAIIALKKS